MSKQPKKLFQHQKDAIAEIKIRNQVYSLVDEYQSRTLDILIIGHWQFFWGRPHE